MPFCSTFGSLKLNSDITHDRYDGKTGEKIQEGNNLPSLDLTAVEQFDFEPNGRLYEEMVWRGQPNKQAMNWNDIPVFRVLTNRFKTGHEWIEDKKEREKTDWGRFMRDYEIQTSGRVPTVIFYEPDVEDIRVDTDTNTHFPLWVIDKLIEWGEYPKALILNKVNLPKVPRLTKPELDRIMKEIETRKETESGNVSRSSEPGKSKASK